MKVFEAKRGWLLAAVFTMLMAIALPATALGHDHGKRHKARHLDKKCAKFVNCHDARDGRRINRSSRARGLVLANNGRLVRRDRDDDRDFGNDISRRNRRLREREHDGRRHDGRRDNDRRHDDNNHNR